MKSPFRKGKEVKRHTSFIGSASKSYAIDTRQNQSFHISMGSKDDGSVSGSDYNSDEEKFPALDKKEEELKKEGPPDAPGI
jgi:hypothetical protein